MKRRMMIMLIAVGVLVTGLALIKFQQIRTAMAQGAAFQMPPEAITTVVTRREDWSATRTTIGSVAAVQGVTLSADLPGVVASIDFESGRQVEAGHVLMRLDTSQERAQLRSAEAQLNLAKLNLDRMVTLRDKQVVSTAEHDRATAEFAQAEARVSEIRAVIDRKQIRAPFTGALGIRQVNLGQYLNAGDPIVPLQSLDPVYVNFSVPQDGFGGLRVGAEVRVHADSAGNVAGRITAINSVIDEATRNVQVQATFRNPGGRLRPGMFVDVELALGRNDVVVTLPASAINYAPYGNSVFVVADIEGQGGAKYRGVQQRFIKVGPGRGDQVAILSGLESGEEVATSGVFKLRNGAAVLVRNEVRPGNDPAPKPEDS
jgi:membrane fusion protein, multidrug efflux system